jgi:hypothetical protein
LTKPDGTDLVDVAVLNTNFDKIDSNIASTKIQATKPSTANAGDLWWDSNTGTLYLYYVDANSSQWVAATSDPVNIGVVANQSERDAQYPTPGQGMRVYRTDLGVTQTYYGLFNASTNPGGRDVAGWYNEEKSQGLVPIRATTATFVGGTGSVNSMGRVTFSGCSAVQLDGVFSSKYRNYKVIYTGTKTATTGDTDIYLRLAVGGVVKTTNYNGGWTHVGITDTAWINRSNSTYFAIASQFYADRKSFQGDIINPNIIGWTEANILAQGVNSTKHTFGIGGGYQYDDVAYDGLVFGVSSSTASGTFEIYGYND